MARLFLLLALLFAAPCARAAAQAGETGAAGAKAPAPEDTPRGFRVGGEIKLAFRDSAEVRTPLAFPFPPSFIPAGRTEVTQGAVSPGASLELANLALVAEGDLATSVAARAVVHVLDLHNRNPTSSDDRVLLREAWVRVGPAIRGEDEDARSGAYVLAGLAPRFTRQLTRRLESYGLWGTAVGRFEQPQVQAGLALGRHLYVRAAVGNGNPVFFRDPNALAGDNGTPENTPGAVNPLFESGFPILYDAKPADLNVSGRFEVGGGVGLRAAGQGGAIDVLGWVFTREMAEEARLRGTFYEGELDLLRGVGFPLPFRGDRKREAGVNLEARWEGLRVFAQYVDQEIAELPRRGFEAEIAYLFDLGGLFALGDTPVGQWIQPVVRVSRIDNRFVAPPEYPGQSVAWDWTKLDLGLRFGIAPNVHLTVEHARNAARTHVGTRHPDETLVTLRTAF